MFILMLPYSIDPSKKLVQGHGRLGSIAHEATRDNVPGHISNGIIQPIDTATRETIEVVGWWSSAVVAIALE
jgi:hypothetical protein